MCSVISLVGLLERCKGKHFYMINQINNKKFALRNFFVCYTAQILVIDCSA